MSKSDIPIFKMLWKMKHQIDDAEERYMGGRVDPVGSIISKYAGIIEDRLQNSGHCASSDGLMTYATYQLEEELERRKNESDDE